MKKILIVEDNEDLLETTSEILSLAGYSVTTASNGQEGLAFAKETLPNLIISDIMMPKMNGYDMVRALRSDATTAMIPFIFLTAKAQSKDLLVGAASGAYQYLTKPFMATDLLKAVNGIMDVLPNK